MLRRYLLLSLAVLAFNLLLMGCCGCGAFFIVSIWLHGPAWLGVIAGLVMGFIGRVAACSTVLDFSEHVLNLPQPTDELAHDHYAPEA